MQTQAGVEGFHSFREFSKDSFMEQPTDTNLELSSTFAIFAWKNHAFNLEALLKTTAKPEKLFECKRCTILIGSEKLLNYRNWLYFHTWKSCTLYGFFTCENKTYRFPQMSFLEGNSRVTGCTCSKRSIMNWRLIINELKVLSNVCKKFIDK